MTNNRGNNRRRGRGNGNNRPQGGGQQVNRIDSRARGNAPQLLEKYRKLAHDAHLNGDRVQAEYYLQFADHYFRVIADTRLRQEEQRARREDRWQDNGEPYRDDGEDGGEFSVESDFPAFDQPPVYTRREREDRPQREPRRSEAAAPAPAREEPVAEPGNEAAEDADPRNIYEPAENPFVRENRTPRAAPRPRREREGREREERRPRRAERREEEPAGEPVAEAAAPAPAPEQPAAVALDPTSLPPAISTGRRSSKAASAAAAAAAAAATGEEPAPAPKRRTRRKAVSDDGEALQTAS